MNKLLILCLGILLSVGARAEETSEVPTGKKVYRLAPIVVTATRYPEYLQNIPAHSTQLNFPKLKNHNFLSLGEMLKDFSAGEMNFSGALGQVQTFSLRGSSTSQVLFLLEGRRLNYLTNGIFNLSDLSLDNLEKVEIVRGPLSSLYGANALGGVVNLIPAPPAKGNFSSTFLYGDDKTLMSNLNFASEVRKFGFDMGLERKESEGERENSDYSAWFLHSTLLYHFTAKSDIKLYFTTQRDDMGLPGPVPDPLSIPKFGSSSVSSLFDHQKDDNYSMDFTFHLRTSEKSDGILTRLFFDRRKMDYSTRYDYMGEVDEDYSYLTESSGGFMQYSFSFKESNRITLGLDFSSDRLRAQQKSIYTASQTSSSLSWKPNSNTLGLWGNSSWNIRRFTFQLGGRFDLPSNFENIFSPNAGLVYHLNHELSLKLNYGKAYRAPTFNDLYWPSGGNKDLKPEKGGSIETGMVFSGEKVSYQISLYHREVKNLISWQPLGENGLWQPFNLDRFNSSGIEMELDYQVVENFGFNLNYAYTQGKEIKRELVYDDYFSGEKRFEEMKRKARFLPENNFNLNLNMKMFSSLSTQLSFNFRSEKLNYYPDYTYYPEIRFLTKRIKPSANMDVNINQKLRSLTFFIKFNNLFNERTPTQFGNSISDLDYPNPGRRIFAGIRIDISD
jgi:outer membrane cobalamin receptor